MVAIGDEHRLRSHQPGHLRRHRLVGERPHPALHAEVVGRLQRRLPRHDGIEELLHIPFGVGIEPEHLAQIRPAGSREEETVLLRARHRLLVGMDVAGAEPLQANSRHHPAAHKRSPLDLELLVVDVERRGRLLHHHPLVAPTAEELRRPGVFVCPLVIAGLLPIELDPNHVGGVPLVERLLERRVDDVVRRGDHLREGADVLGVVAKAAERGNVGHGGRSFLGGAGRGTISPDGSKSDSPKRLPGAPAAGRPFHVEPGRPGDQKPTGASPGRHPRREWNGWRPPGEPGDGDQDR